MTAVVNEAAPPPQEQQRGRSPELLGAAGSVLLLVGCFLPWATYAGFPGKMSLAGFPGGARLYPLLLALFGVLFLLPIAQRGRALRAAGWFSLTIVAFNGFFIGYAGGGLVNLGYGIWVALVGAVAMTVGARLLQEPDSPLKVRLPWEQPDANQIVRSVVEAVLVVSAVLLVLFVFVVGLGIDTASIASGEDTRIADALSLNQLTNEGQFLGFMIMVVGISVALSRLGVSPWFSELTHRHRNVLVIAGLVAALAFPLTQDGDSYALRIAASIGVFAAAAIGLNVVVGLAGLLDLGYIAFFGVGAYVAAIFSGAASSVVGVNLPFPLVFVLGAAVAGLFGLILGAPTLRLRGDYLAIVTLGFGEIFRISVNNLDGSAGPSLTNGPNGISGVPHLEAGNFSFGDDHELFGIVLPFFSNYYVLEVFLVAAAMAAFLRMSESRIGRAWVAIREDEVAAAAMGINTTRLKLLAFMIGATLAGAAGTVNAHVVRVVAPDSFTFIESALLLSAVILGGMGTVPGALLGATVLYLLPEKLRFLQDLRLLAFGLVLVLIMRFRPEGLVPSKRRAREFHEDSGGGDALAAPPGHGA